MVLLHSIYLTGGQTDAEDLPWRIAANIDSLKAHHPDVEHRLFGDEPLRAFIAANFDRDVLSAYEQLAALVLQGGSGPLLSLVQERWRLRRPWRARPQTDR